MDQENFAADKPSNNPSAIPAVAIVGRPNVGKSSLFNAIIRQRLAIVHESSGVTRDRIAAPANWNGKHFLAVDTGGLGTLTAEERKVDMWDRNIRAQVEIAIEGAEVIVFVVNAMDGIVPLDVEVAGRLHESGKKVVVAVNKIDDQGHERLVPEFTALGYDKLVPVSCLHTRGIDDLLEEVLSDYEISEGAGEQPERFKIAVIGRPNVGKSSMVNRLLGEERVMVSEIAGTTRDSVDVDFELELGGEAIPASLIDTAGLRKRGKVSDAIEMFSAMRARKAIERADLVLFLVEAKPDGVTAQDRKIASIIQECAKPCVIAANKWDICSSHDKKAIVDEIRFTLPGMEYAPLVFASALNGYNLDKMLETIGVVKAQMEVRIPTSMLNKVVEDAIRHTAPPVVGLAPLKIYYSTMTSSAPATFLLFVNSLKNCAPNYLAYLNNRFRDSFGLTGIPIIVKLRERPKKVESIRTTQASPSRKKSGERAPAIKIKPGLKGTKAMKAKRKAMRPGGASRRGK